MAITRQEMEHIAALARLEMSGEHLTVWLTICRISWVW